MFGSVSRGTDTTYTRYIHTQSAPHLPNIPTKACVYTLANQVDGSSQTHAYYLLISLQHTIPYYWDVLWK
jgi:hypothetical protein